ncbi:MAG: hypothetical protein A3K19_08225 [Lentisphaerae bacterium RIFOXYB12_FULL_65_16]|nr:MAG: hypothetical protein A3K18_00225 [Lentisphaerae bacterium RIFOXYA12_64_32]OGV89856.1 MAG: hypothetical protein A3K19_08225 [Lentisphaerae bacterium RIFOXYB12_FULL_65_16]
MVEIEVPSALRISTTADTLNVELSDGRTIGVPLAWFPRLLHATASERRNWRLIGGGEGVHWDDLDEDISVEGLLAGRVSGESQKSLGKWLQVRDKERARPRGSRGLPGERTLSRRRPQCVR